MGYFYCFDDQEFQADRYIARFGVGSKLKLVTIKNELNETYFSQTKTDLPVDVQSAGLIREELFSLPQNSQNKAEVSEEVVDHVFSSLSFNSI